MPPFHYFIEEAKAQSSQTLLYVLIPHPLGVGFRYFPLLGERVRKRPVKLNAAD
jgi:hypothetical protein